MKSSTKYFIEREMELSICNLFLEYKPWLSWTTWRYFYAQIIFFYSNVTYSLFWYEMKWNIFTYTAENFHSHFLIKLAKDYSNIITLQIEKNTWQLNTVTDFLETTSVGHSNCAENLHKIQLQTAKFVQNYSIFYKFKNLKCFKTASEVFEEKH